MAHNPSWNGKAPLDIYKQAESGVVLLVAMGTDQDYPIIWDKLVLNASQVTNPSIAPLREATGLRTFLGCKPDDQKAHELLDARFCKLWPKSKRPHTCTPTG